MFIKIHMNSKLKIKVKNISEDNNMVIKYIIFDFNGTLSNDAEIGFKSCNHMLEWYGQKPVSFKRFLDTFTLPWINFFLKNGVPEEKINIETHQDEYQKFHKTLLEKELRLKDDVVEVLTELKKKGFTLGVLSARNTEQLKLDLSKLKVAHFFDAIIGEESIYHDGTRLEKDVKSLVHRLKIKEPGSVLYIGDMVIDIKIARKEGFLSGAITGGWQSREHLIAEKPAHFFENFKEIIKAVDKQ